MNHVVGRSDNANFLVNGNNQRVVDLQQIVINHFTGLGSAIVRHFALNGIKRGHKADAFALGQGVELQLPLSELAGFGVVLQSEAWVFAQQGLQGPGQALLVRGRFEFDGHVDRSRARAR